MQKNPGLALEQTKNLPSKSEEEFNGPFGPIPSEVVERVRRRYGPCADQVLQEAKDPRFHNPILTTYNGETVSRTEEFLGRPWSVAEPKPGSLTEYYRKNGIIVPCNDGWKFKKGDGNDALITDIARADDDVSDTRVCPGAEQPGNSG